jgi:hypothetical protein
MGRNYGTGACPGTVCRAAPEKTHAGGPPGRPHDREIDTFFVSLLKRKVVDQLLGHRDEVLDVYELVCGMR